jgi:hypothetical protein
MVPASDNLNKKPSGKPLQLPQYQLTPIKYLKVSTFLILELVYDG